MIRILLFLLCLSTPSLAQTLSGRVVGVNDGDTLTLLVAHQSYKIRLAQIDAPEKGQPFGERSRQSLAELVFGQEVSVEVEAEDRYKRLVGTIRRNGSNINLQQVQRGMAWVYVQYAHDAGMLAAEQQARAASRGLWSQPDPQPPWQWRRQQKKNNDWDWLLGLFLDQQKSRTTAATAMRCGNKLSCNQMKSCEEARFYLTQCGLDKLDGNRDGTPCEALCR